MTPAQVPESFERVMDCEVRELLAWLPMALPGAETTIEHAAHRAIAHFSQGTLTLTWQALVPRRIALLQIPQLRVSFCYVGVDEDRRHQIQRRFDLATQRGGG
jgi:hypothetical protein